MRLRELHRRGPTGGTPLAPGRGARRGGWTWTRATIATPSGPPEILAGTIGAILQAGWPLEKILPVGWES